jgi:hypothetical protein
MFEKVGIPILGLVENMSIHICSKCGHEEHIFGHGGGEQMCKDYDVEFLGALPLELAIREMADAGKPTVVGAPDSRAAEIYRTIARRVAVKVAERAKDMTPSSRISSCRTPDFARVNPVSPSPGNRKIRAFQRLVIRGRQRCPSNPTSGSAAWRKSTA